MSGVVAGAVLQGGGGSSVPAWILGSGPRMTKVGL